jgi:hypothetical protein
MNQNSIPQKGSISCSNGKATIVVDDNGTTEPFDNFFLAKQLKPYIKDKNLLYAYRQSIAKVVAILENPWWKYDRDKIKEILCWMKTDKRIGVRGLYQQWMGWLNWIQSVSMMAKGKNVPTKNFRENYEKIFASEI